MFVCCVYIFVQYNNFGHVCIPFKVSVLLSVYRVIISTAANRKYVWSIMHLQLYLHVF